MLAFCTESAEMLKLLLDNIKLDVGDVSKYANHYLAAFDGDASLLEQAITYNEKSKSKNINYLNIIHLLLLQPGTCITRYCYKKLDTIDKSHMAYTLLSELFHHDVQELSAIISNAITKKTASSFFKSSNNQASTFYNANDNTILLKPESHEQQITNFNADNRARIPMNKYEKKAQSLAEFFLTGKIEEKMLNHIIFFERTAASLDLRKFNGMCSADKLIYQQYLETPFYKNVEENCSPKFLFDI